MDNSTKIEYFKEISNNQKAFQKVKIIDGAFEEIREDSYKTICWKKTLGKIEPGSIIEGIFNLSIMSLGVGLLALPKRVKYMSLFMTPIIIISGGIINYWTLTILGKASRKYQITSYEKIIKLLLNEKVSYFFSIIMNINKFGRLIVFQIIIYKCLGGVINKLFSFGYKNMDNFAERSFWREKNIKILVCFLITYLILFPLCLIKTISKMRYSSAIGVFCLFLVILIILVQFPSFYYHNIHQRKNNINFLNLKYGFDRNFQFFQSISIIIYAFDCHAGLFPILSSMNRPIKIRVQKVLKNAVLIDVISCIIISLSGYLSQPFHTPEIIIEREDIYKHDILMIIGDILFICTLITKIGANYNGFRITILNLLNYDSINYPNFINLIITFFTLFSTTLIASLFKNNISDYLGLIGTFCSIITVIIMPGMIYIKGNTYSIYHKKNILTIIFMLIFSFIGLCTIFCTINKILFH